MPGPDAGPDIGPDQLGGMPMLNVDPEPEPGNVVYVRPALVAIAADVTPEESIACYVGDAFLHDLTLQHGDGDAFALPDGATVSANLTASGDIVSTRAAQIVTGSEGLVRIQITAADTSRSGRLALTLTVTIGEMVQTFTAPFVNVKKK